MSRQGLIRKRTNKNIKDFWQREAKEWGESPQVTIRDHFFRNHELHILLNIIPRCNHLLDIGCGTGLATLLLSKRANYVTGVDYSKNMIKWAIRAKTNRLYRASLAENLKLPYNLDIKKSCKVDFLVADILNLDIPFKFDVVTGQRILINLSTQKQQMKALENLRRNVVDNSMLFLTEATHQGHARTDKYRKRYGLPILEKYWHNNYLDEDNYKKWVNLGWQVVKILYFETYMLLSKVIYPAAIGSENCTFLSAANESACNIANIFPSKGAVDEVGVSFMLQLYGERVELYNKSEGVAIKKWIRENADNLPDWKNLGHQQLLIVKSI